MLLVVDANVLFSALIARGKTCDLMFSERLQLIAPEFLFMELEEHKDELIEKSSLSEYKEFLSKAKTVSPDPDDIDLFALALKLDCPLWAQEKAFKNQSEVKVFSTTDLVSLLA